MSCEEVLNVDSQQRFVVVVLVDELVNLMGVVPDLLWKFKILGLGTIE